MRIYLVDWGGLMFMTEYDLLDAFSKNGDDLGITVYMLNDSKEWVTVELNTIENIASDLKVLNIKAEK